MGEVTGLYPDKFSRTCSSAMPAVMAAQQVAKPKAADPAAQQRSRMVETCPQDMGCTL